MAMSTMLSRQHGIAVKAAQAPGCFDVNCLPWKRHPFYDAAEQGDADVCAQLLTTDITLTKIVVGRHFYSAWHIAAEKGHVAVLRVLVTAVLDCTNAAAQLNSSVRRFLSIERTGTTLVQHFLNSGCKGGYTPLVLAAKHGRAAAVDYLLSVGADPWETDWFGLCALHHAALNNQCEVIHALCKQPMAFSEQASSLNLADTRYVDVVDDCGWTALHHAALCNKLEAVKTLVSHDANLVARTEFHNLRVELLPTGLTALHLAAFRGDLAMAKAILRTFYESRADLFPSQTASLGPGERSRRQHRHPDPRLYLTRTGRLPYHFAVRLRHFHMLEWLDPTIPLMFLFGGGEAQQDAAGQEVIVGVPRLTALAATALNTLLSQQLEHAEVRLKEHADMLAHTQQPRAAELAPLLPLGWLRNTTRIHPEPSAVTNNSRSSSTAAMVGSFAHSRAQSNVGTEVTPRHQSHREHSDAQPSSGRVDQKKEADILDPGEGISSVQRFKQRMKMGCTTPSQANTIHRDLRLMGLDIPQHPSREPVATFLQGREAAIVDRRELLSTWHTNRGSHGRLMMTVGAQRPAHRQAARVRASEPGRAPDDMIKTKDIQQPRNACEDGNDAFTSLISALPPASGFRNVVKKTNHQCPPPSCEDQQHPVTCNISTTTLQQSACPPAGATDPCSSNNTVHHAADSANGAEDKGGKPAADPEVLQRKETGVKSSTSNIDDDDLCPVCLDALPNVLLEPCASHKLCVDCTRDLLKRHQLTPALCPYCRTCISGLTSLLIMPGRKVIVTAQVHMQGS